MNKNSIYVIVGPTASGKTKLSIELAKRLNACIINADASQFRRGLDIGTAKIKTFEMEGIDHYLIDIIDTTEEFSIYDFQVLGRKILNREIEKRNVIIVGGSGLYINALLFDYDLSSEARDKSEEKYKDLSNQELYDKLSLLNLELAKKTHANNRNRVIRYLELVENDSLPKKAPTLLYDNVHIYFIDKDRSELYDNINKRTIQMINDGWISEVKTLKDKGIDVKTIKEIGYKEIDDYLNGLIDKDELIDIISKKTRNYAKRQVTWFKHKIDCKFIQSIDDIDVMNNYNVICLDTSINLNKDRYLCKTLIKIFKKVLDDYFEFNNIKIIKENNDDVVVYYVNYDIDVNKLNEDMNNIKFNHSLGRFIDIYVNQENKGINNNDSIDFILNSMKKYLSIEIKKMIYYACNLELNLKYKFGLVTPYHKHNDVDYFMKRDLIDTIIYPFLDMFDAGFVYDDFSELNENIDLIRKRALFLVSKKTNGVKCYEGLLLLLGDFLGLLSYCIKNYKDFEKDNTYNYIINNLDILKRYDDSELYHLLIKIVRDNDDNVLLKESGSYERYQYYKEKIASVDYRDFEKIQEISLECERNGISIGDTENIFIVIVFYSLFKKIM